MEKISPKSLIFAASLMLLTALCLNNSIYAQPNPSYAKSNFKKFYGEKNKSENKQSINFFVGDWKHCLKMASMLNKPIFVYVYNEYTPACKTMVNQVFTDDKLKNFYSENFINYKLDLHAESGEGVKLAQQYGLQKYPAYLYFKNNGDLVNQDSELKSIQEMLELGTLSLEHAVNKVNVTQTAWVNYLDLLLQYQNGYREPQFLYDLAYEVKNYSEPYQHIAEEYIEKLPNSSLTNYKNAKFILDFADDITARTFNILVTNKEIYNNIIGTDAVNAKILSTLQTAAINAATNNDSETFQKILYYLEKALLPDTKEVSFYLKMMYYETAYDWENYTKTVKQYIAINPVKDIDLLNQIAWKFAGHCNEKVDLNLAHEWSKAAYTKNPNRMDFVETYAATLYRIGKKEKALEELEKVKKTARLKGDYYGTLVKLSDIINSNRPIPDNLDEDE